MRRRLELRPGELRETMTVQAGGVRTIDLVTQLPPGTGPDGPIGSEATPKIQAGVLTSGAGYEHLTDARDVSSIRKFGAVLPHGRLTLTADGSKAEMRILAAAPGNPAADRHSVLIRRRTAESATFVTTLSWRPSAGTWRSSSSSSG
jgi:hypothetical protein